MMAPVSHRVLNCATHGANLSLDVANQLRTVAVVSVDFSEVDRMTPSFANSFLMPLLAEFGRDYLRIHLVFHAANPVVSQALRDAANRFDRGIKLSSMRQFIACAAD
ncbi:MAG: STAS-like domain-containing protein [Phycisphaerales bacterium]